MQNTLGTLRLLEGPRTKTTWIVPRCTHAKSRLLSIFAFETAVTSPSENRPPPMKSPICLGKRIKERGHPVSAADSVGPRYGRRSRSPRLYLFTRPLLTSCRLGKKIQTKFLNYLDWVPKRQYKGFRSLSLSRSLSLFLSLSLFTPSLVSKALPYSLLPDAP